MAGSVRVTGISDVQDALRAMAARIQAATPVAVATATALVEERARANLSRTSHRRGTPTPSAPGEPPALITGALRGSFDILGPTETGAATWRAVLGPTAVYARIQELGGQTGRNHATTLPARPYLRPAYDDAVHDPAFADVFIRAWGAAVAGA